MAPLSRGSPAPPAQQARAVPRRGRGAAVRTAGGGRVGKRAEGRRGGRGAPGNGPHPRRPLKGPLRAPGPDSKANGRLPARLPSRAGGAEGGGGPQPPRAVWEGTGASRRGEGCGLGTSGRGRPPCAPATGKWGLALRQRGAPKEGAPWSPPPKDGGTPQTGLGGLEDFLEEVASKQAWPAWWAEHLLRCCQGWGDVWDPVRSAGLLSQATPEGTPLHHSLPCPVPTFS